MTRIFKPTLGIILALVITYFGFGYINSYFGWYSHEHYKYRKGSTDIAEAKQRGVFVRQLNYKVEGYSGDLYDFTPFIEKAYTWGYHTSEETKPWTNTDYPYQVAFSYKRSSNFGVLATEETLSKFDSSTGNLILLKQPKLTDTITLEIGGEQIPQGAIIKVFE
jgi:hypothetical protein